MSISPSTYIAKARTESILLIPRIEPEPKVAVVLLHTAVHAVPEALIHRDRGGVHATHVEVYEEPALVLVRHLLEPGHELAREPEPAVLGRDAQRGDVPVSLCAGALGLADYCGVQETW